MNAEFDFPNPFEDEPEELVRTFPMARKSAVIPNSWPPKLVFDLALGLDNPEEIACRYDITTEQLDRLFEFPKFRQDVASLTRELRENNTIFLNKAKVQAETYLEDMHLLMQSADTSPRDKIEIFKTLTKLADLEPKQERLTAEETGSAKVIIRIESNIKQPQFEGNMVTIDA